MLPVLFIITVLSQDPVPYTFPQVAMLLLFCRFPLLRILPSSTHLSLPSIQYHLTLKFNSDCLLYNVFTNSPLPLVLSHVTPCRVGHALNFPITMLRLASQHFPHCLRIHLLASLTLFVPGLWPRTYSHSANISTNVYLSSLKHTVSNTVMCIEMQFFFQSITQPCFIVNLLFPQEG